MPGPAILHRCPHCNRVFDTPPVCVESGEETVPCSDVVPKQFFNNRGWQQDHRNYDTDPQGG